MNKRTRYLTQATYNGQIISLYVCPEIDDFYHFEDDIEKALDSGHIVIASENLRNGLGALSERIGIPAKILRYRMDYYDLQKTLDMGYDPRSKTVFKEGVK